MNRSRDEESDMTLIDVERFDRVTRLTLNRPEKRNALSSQLLDELVANIDEASTDPETSVLVLRGAGQGFSAGFDLGGESSSSYSADRERLRIMRRKLEALWECPIPTIAAVHGFALAGGADLALHCDFLLMSHEAKIGYPPVRNLGVPPTHMWLYRLGPQMTKRMLFTGDSVTGEEAAHLGLALESCDTERLDEVSLNLAQRIALVSRECLVGNKSVVNQGIDLMGRSSLARFAQVEDVLAHSSPGAQIFREDVKRDGLVQALRHRDSGFEVLPHDVVAGKDK